MDLRTEFFTCRGAISQMMLVSLKGEALHLILQVLEKLYTGFKGCCERELLS